MSIPPGRSEGTSGSSFSSSTENPSKEEEEERSGQFQSRDTLASPMTTSAILVAPMRRKSFRKLSTRAKILEASQSRAVSANIPIPERSTSHKNSDWKLSPDSPGSGSFQAFLSEVEQDDAAASLGRFERAGSVSSEVSLPDIQSKPFEYDRLLMFLNPDNPKSPLLKALKKHFAVTFKAMPSYCEQVRQH